MKPAVRRLAKSAMVSAASATAAAIILRSSRGAGMAPVGAATAGAEPRRDDCFDGRDGVRARLIRRDSLSRSALAAARYWRSRPWLRWRSTHPDRRSASADRMRASPTRRYRRARTEGPRRFEYGLRSAWL